MVCASASILRGSGAVPLGCVRLRSETVSGFLQLDRSAPVEFITAGTIRNRFVFADDDVALAR